MSADASSAPPPATDEIIERCLNGDQAAWESIVRLYRRKVFNVAYKFVGRHDQAEDLTQDVFLKLYKSLDTFDRRANFQTWLISVSRNLCIDHYRSVRKERETINRDVDPADFAPVSPDRAPTRSSSSAIACGCCGRRSTSCAPTLRTAVMLRDIQELTYQEIADQLAPARRHRQVAHQPRAEPSWRARSRSCASSRTPSRKPEYQDESDHRPQPGRRPSSASTKPG